MKRFTLLGFSVLTLLLLEGALVVLTIVSPAARAQIGGFVAGVVSVWSGADGEPGLKSSAIDKTERVVNRWVAPLFSEPLPPEPTGEFAACITCHEDYSRKGRFGGVVLNHRSHAERGLQCGTCHTDTAHPQPLPPAEDTCAECHEETTSECQLCHLPGSLSHFSLMGLPEGFADCNTCHLPGSLAGESDASGHHLASDLAFDGSDVGDCTTCHSPANCATCHSSDHPDGWVQSHGEQAFQGSTACNQCHTSNYCLKCHASTPTNPFRKKPLPTGGSG